MFDMWTELFTTSFPCSALMALVMIATANSLFPGAWTPPRTHWVINVAVALVCLPIVFALSEILGGIVAVALGGLVAARELIWIRAFTGPAILAITAFVMPFVLATPTDRTFDLSVDETEEEEGIAFILLLIAGVGAVMAVAVLVFGDLVGFNRLLSAATVAWISVLLYRRRVGLPQYKFLQANNPAEEAPEADPDGPANANDPAAWLRNGP